MQYLLGISAYYHDSAAALLCDGRIVAAAQEERFTRVKGDSSFPHHAIDYCLQAAAIEAADLDYVVFYENAYVKFDRLMRTYHLSAPASLRSYLKAMPSWLTQKLWVEQEICSELGVRKPIHLCDHHVSHAASAFYPSPWDKAAILTIDGVGEWSTASYGIGDGRRVQLQRHLRFPNSLGLLYSAFTSYAGFKINSGEYKLMGLAPYGEPRYAEVILRDLVCVADDGSLQLNQRYFDYIGGLSMTNRRFHELFGGPPRQPESPITQREMDLAASVQVVVNEVVVKMARHVRQETGCEHLCMAGGVALNVVATGGLSKTGVYSEIWTQPAAGDAGGALGAALWMWHDQLGNARTPSPCDSMQGAFLGPEIEPCNEHDSAALAQLGAVWEDLSDDVLVDRIANSVASGRVVALARGRMEFGPRALGARSILGDPRDPEMQSRMNLKVKFRESFRPFAPAVLAEDASVYFDLRQSSPYMLLVAQLRPEHCLPSSPSEPQRFGLDRLQQRRSTLPAITHVDYSARVQTVDERNPFLYRVLLRFKELTGCPVMVNTSFNVRGEPIVATALDAYHCFTGTNIDDLVVGNRYMRRDLQPSLAPAARREIALD